MKEFLLVLAAFAGFFFVLYGMNDSFSEMQQVRKEMYEEVLSEIPYSKEYLNSVSIKDEEITEGNEQYVKVSFVHEGTLTGIVGKYKINYTLPKGSKPYMKYKYYDSGKPKQKSNDSITNNFKKVEIFLPENYDLQIK